MTNRLGFKIIVVVVAGTAPQRALVSLAVIYVEQIMNCDFSFRFAPVRVDARGWEGNIPLTGTMHTTALSPPELFLLFFFFVLRSLRVAIALRTLPAAAPLSLSDDVNLTLNSCTLKIYCRTRKRETRD